MKQKVALLHTSMVFIQRERLVYDVFAEILPNVELINIIDDGMLSEVVSDGRISPSVTKRMCLYALAAETMGVDAIFSMCSSLGPTVDTARKIASVPVVKIDDGMAQLAADTGKRIGILATVPTTLPPTRDLIQYWAGEKGKIVETRETLCRGAFDLLMQGQTEEHDAMVLQTAKETASWADILVLAQCSMARLAPRLESEVGRPVLSSPHLGVMHLKEILDA